MVVQGQLPEFESALHAEWRIANGDILVVRLDRRTGEWTGERQQPDPKTGEGRGPQALSPQEVEVIVRARDLRFRDGSKADFEPL